MTRRARELTEKEMLIIKRSLTDEEAIMKFERHCLLKNCRPAYNPVL